MAIKHVERYQELRGKTDQTARGKNARKPMDTSGHPAPRSKPRRARKCVPSGGRATDERANSVRTSIREKREQESAASPVDEQLLMHERELADKSSA